MMYDNYHTDPRVLAGEAKSMFKSIDTKRMKAVVEYTEWDDEDTEITHEVEMPIAWEVCYLCNGRGSHVNPSIDCNGLTAEDFAEDPDFAENYFGGMYDQTCNACGGRTTVPVIQEDYLNDEQKEHLKKIHKEAEEQAAYERERAWERRMGY
jgi:hypothetical protein